MLSSGLVRQVDGRTPSCFDRGGCQCTPIRQIKLTDKKMLHSMEVTNERFLQEKRKALLDRFYTNLNRQARC